MAEWRNVVGYPGYQVSNLGEVQSKRFKRPLVKAFDSDGYHIVTLYNINKYTCKVHRLVADAFLPNPLNLPHIDHINREKTDNKVSNLRWADERTNCLNRTSSIATPYIYRWKNKYLVKIRRPEGDFEKVFQDEDEATFWRDAYLESIT